MSSIRAIETKPEILVRKFLFSKGLRFRKNVGTLSGKPDIVLPKYNVIIFIHGCFWHGHKCKYAKLPATRKKFWQTKIFSNQSRDKAVKKELKRDGWRVITIWQCEIKNKEKAKRKLASVLKAIK